MHHWLIQTVQFPNIMGIFARYVRYIQDLNSVKQKFAEKLSEERV